MLLPNGEVAIVANVKWIDHVPPKPSPFQLDPGAADNVKTAAYRKRRREEEIIPHPEFPTPPTVPGEKRLKRVATAAEEEVINFLSTIEELTPAVIPITDSEPAEKESPSDDHDELYDVSAAPSPAPAPVSAPASPAARPMTRSMDIIDPALVKTFDLNSFRDLTPDPLALLAKANPSKPYEPRTYKEAMADSYRKMFWQIAMEEEIDSLSVNGTWTLVDLPSNAHALGGRWVFKLKRGPAGEILRHKAR